MKEPKVSAGLSDATPRGMYNDNYITDNGFPTNQRLPGAINLVFYDGHSQSVPLENLWTLYWSKDGQVPSPRPQ